MNQVLETIIEEYPNLTKPCNKEYITKSGLLTDSKDYIEKLDCTYLGKCIYQEREIFIVLNII
ncbi:MAG: hypothetical protein PF569_05515 [Candidatus Woesearchaeota archaeon]|jgi:hypothetical protein|nr:hypothetical protein [Candidatus Woesearchaeota archaeon]